MPARGEGGQALVLAVIVMFVLALVPAIVVNQLDHQSPLVTSTLDSETALAAAEAGIQNYRNLLDVYSDYWQYSASSEPGPAAGGANAAFTGYEAVPETAPSNPPEAFTYSPDTSDLAAASGSQFAGDVLLQVIGRAGSGINVSYRRLVAAFSLSGVLTDVYFSNYEQPGVDDVDQWYGNTYQCVGGYFGGCTAAKGANAYDEITTDVHFSPPGSSATVSEPAAQALCEYDADQPNSYVDWYSANVASVYPPSSSYPGYFSNTAYGPSNPYYGPWYGTWPDPANPSYQFGESAGAPGSAGDSSACNVNYWVTGDTFNGPVYSEDELTTCGQPSFTSLATAVPKDFNFPAGWPGTEPPATGPTGQQVSHPYGYVDDPFDDCGQPGQPGDQPSIADGQVQFGVTQSLPPVATELATDIKTGVTPGCLYTGPTLIRFSYDQSTGTNDMEIWSPLTKDTYAHAGVQCGSFGDEVNSQHQVVLSTADIQTVPITTSEVIYVQSLPTSGNNAWSTLPTAESNATVSGCIDPWIAPGPSSAVTTTSCTEGDVVVQGMVAGQVTVAAAASIVVGHSLGLGCALAAGAGSDPAIPNNIAGCASSTDVIGLIAAQNIWLAHGLTSADHEPASACQDDTDLGASAVQYQDLLPGEQYVAPTSSDPNPDDQCYLHNPVIDAAMAALQGFLEVQNWKQGNGSGGTLYVNGSDAVNNAGQFGEFETSQSGGIQIVAGYALSLDYDTRLRYLTPPNFVQATASVWDVAGWVTCGNSTSSTTASCEALPS